MMSTSYLILQNEIYEKSLHYHLIPITSVTSFQKWFVDKDLLILSLLHKIKKKARARSLASSLPLVACEVS
jgi:hypothetical protein